MAITRIVAGDSPYLLPEAGPGGMIAVDTSAGPVVLVLPDTPASPWANALVLKVSADANALSLQPNLTSRVNDGDLADPFVLPGSNGATPATVGAWTIGAAGVGGIWIAKALG